MGRRRRIRWRSDLEVQRTVRRLLRELDVSAPLDVDDLCSRLGDRRGRPIHCIPFSLPVPGPFGMWLATTRRDLVLYQAETTPGHQEHIILHELGHIISDHAGDEHDDELLQDILPSLPPETVRRALRRTGYDADHEREAEMVATVIKDWAVLLGHLQPDSSTPTPALSPEPPMDEGVYRLQRALEDRQGWL